jgi:hypothetical protein
MRGSLYNRFKRWKRMVVDGMPILEGQNSWGWNQEEEQQV